MKKYWLITISKNGVISNRAISRHPATWLLDELKYQSDAYPSLIGAIEIDEEQYTQFNLAISF